MKVMISLPMHGKKDKDVEARIKELKKLFAKMHIDVINSFDKREIKVDSNNPRVYYLGRTIMKYMHDVDAVYFDAGWENAKGCRIERAICREYDIKILDSDFLFEKEYPSLISTIGTGGIVYSNSTISAKQ